MQRGVHSTSDDITIVILVILITTAAADIARSDRPTHLVDMYVSTPSDVTEGIQVVKSFQLAAAAPSATQLRGEIKSLSNRRRRTRYYITQYV